MLQHNLQQTTRDFGYYRVAAVIPAVAVADVQSNEQSIADSLDDALAQGASLVVTPELALTAYTCGDLLLSDHLLDHVEAALARLAATPRWRHMVVVVGAPLRRGPHLLNCGVVLHGGKVVAAVPKSYIPNYKEFYEKRWFTSALIPGDTLQEVTVAGQRVPCGTDLLVDHGEACIAIEVCEDLWVPVPPSSIAALNGANVVVNLSASDEVVGKNDYLRRLVTHQSSQSMTAYVYAGAGHGESTTDLVFAGNAMVAENGTILCQSKRFVTTRQVVTADVDLPLLANERRVNTSFSDNVAPHRKHYRHIALERPAAVDVDTAAPRRRIDAMPFVPQDERTLHERCQEIVSIQTHGLMRRLEHTGIKALVVGVSGGLDSTLALMVAVRAFDALGLPRAAIHGITMPGFGTTGRTHANALRLMRQLGVTVKEISIVPAVEQHFKDIGHDGATHDVTYENSQARERTQLLMDYANKVGALVLGTGDLSELALGWATYNGDHMSMYNVNGSIPKTLARHLIMWLASEENTGTPGGLVVHETLLDVLHTPISPELTPADAQGNIAQKTEDLIGPYELHDFFLFNMLRYGYGPQKILMLATHAFAAHYEPAVIKQWLRTFLRRFFAQQFKRSCLPDGPKVGTVSLSPRGDWRMPSDATARLWLSALDD